MGVHSSHPLTGIKHILLDIDHVVNHYGPKYAREFSKATAESFCDLHPELASRYEIDELTKKAVEAYATTGRTTSWFADTFGIDEMELYQHHHDELCKPGGFLDKEFKQGRIPIDPELPGLLAQVKDLGIKVHAFTNGTEGYARTILRRGRHGIDHLMDHIIGMDSFENPNMLDKRNPEHIARALHHIGRIDMQSVGSLPINCNDTAIIDDSSPNIRACKDFNIFGVLPLRRNPTSKQDRNHADQVVGDVKDFLKEIIAAHANENRAPAPVQKRVARA